MSLYFESKLTSYEDVDYRVRLYSDSYEGFSSSIIGGAGSAFYVQSDWTDYLEASQSLVIEYPSSFAVDTISIFSYDDVLDRTTIVLNTITYDGTEVLIKNNFGDAASFVPSFSPKLIDLKTDWQGDQDIVLEPLLTSETTITFANVEEDRTSVDTAFFDRFFENYLIASDNDLKVVIHRDGGTGYELEWVGSLVRDLIEWNDESSPRAYTFKAIDGIDKLKNVDYTGDLSALTSNKIIDVIKNVLDILELKEYWGASEGYIRESIEFENSEVVGVNASDSPLDYTYLPDSVIVEKDNNTDSPKFFSAYDVLRGIMELFSCKFVHAQGLYQIVQVRNYDVSAYSYRLYNKTNNTYSASSYNHINSDLRVLSGGKFGYLYGLRKSKISTFSATRENIALNVQPSLLYLNASGVTTAIPTTATTGGVASFSYNIGKVQGFTSPGKKITIQYDIEYFNSLVSGTWAYDLEIVIDIVDLAGTKFYAGGMHNGSYLPPYWGDDAVSLIRNYKRYATKISKTNKRVRFTDTTLEIPYNMEECQITVSFNVINKGGPVDYGPYFLRKLAIFLPIDGDDRDELLTVENPNNNFTKELVIDPIIINEGGGFVTTNTLSVDYNYNGGSANINPVRFWDGGFDLEGTLSGLRVLEAMSLQFANLEKYMGTFVNDEYTPAQTVQYNNKVYFPMACEKDYQKDEIQGTWVEIINAKAGLSTGVVVGTKDGVVSDEYNQDTKNVIEQTYNVGSLSDVINSGTITSIFINSSFDIKVGDKLQIINVDNQVIKEIVAAQDLDLNLGKSIFQAYSDRVDLNLGTTENEACCVAFFDSITDNENRELNIESTTFDFQITDGFDVITAFRKLHTSEVYRFDSLQHTDARVAPTVVSDLKEGEIVFVGRDIYVKEAGEIYRHRAAPYLAE